MAESMEERNPFLVKMGKVKRVRVDGEEVETYESSIWVWWMDALSSVLSTVAFFVACWFAFREGKKDMIRFNDHIDLWRESVYVINTDTENVHHELALAVKSSVDGLETALQGFCPNGTHELYNSTRVWDDQEYSGTAVIHLFGSFSPWGVLLWIFVVSIVFQSSRVTGYFYYDPRKPDYWRWLEYALTSPFQILLIATGVFIQERGHVMSLMGLQGALVMLGFLNEKRIDKFYKRALKRDLVVKRGPQVGRVREEVWVWPLPKKAKLWISTLLSWIFFTIIWYTIIHRFQEQVNNLDDCHFEAEMPREVRFIVWTQCLLFGLFGVVQFVQVFYTTMYKDAKVLQSGNLNDMPLPNADFWVYNTMIAAGLFGFVFFAFQFSWYAYAACLAVSCTGVYLRLKTPMDTTSVASQVKTAFSGDLKHVTTIKTLRQKRWDAVAFRYSFLSVTAKTLLEYGFIALVLAREEMTP